MKRLLLATALTATATGAVAEQHMSGEPIKMGIILGFTGPIESITPNMGAAAELAISEINEAGGILDGRMIEPVRADSTCIDAAAASAAAERLITSDGIAGIVGADCSGVTGAILANVAVPNGVAMVSPSATSPALSDAEDNDLFFRTAPSDARQGKVLADILMSRDLTEIAVTYTNNDYGKGLSDAFIASFEEAGGTVTLSAPHEDGKADYSAEIGALASAGGDALVVLGYSDQGGRGMIQASYDTGAFETFVLGDGMFSTELVSELSDALEGSFGTVPWSEGEGTEAFAALAEEAGFDPATSYTRESYDAAALLALAMQAAGSTDSTEYVASLMEVANEPGEKILPGEFEKAIQILSEGGDIDYVGATNVELIGPGEASGTYREYDIEGGDFVTVEIR